MQRIKVTRMTCGKEYRSWSSSFCNLLYSPASASLLGPNNFLIPHSRRLQSRVTTGNSDCAKAEHAQAVLRADVRWVWIRRLPITAYWMQSIVHSRCWQVWNGISTHKQEHRKTDQSGWSIDMCLGPAVPTGRGKRISHHCLQQPVSKP
jgi:hypothetical protein